MQRDYLSPSVRRSPDRQYRLARGHVVAWKNRHLRLDAEHLRVSLSIPALYEAAAHTIPRRS